MTTSEVPGIDPSVPPSGPGCVDCDAGGGWWFHLRRCTQCGHIGCCDSSPAQHADAHAQASGHPVVRSYEPGEDWYWNYRTKQYEESSVELAPPLSHPGDQPVPGPGDRVPADWMSRLN
jgi:hypothetical protein